jgi:hypothetical protein
MSTIRISVDASEVIALGEELDYNAPRVADKVFRAVARNGFKVVQTAQVLAPVDTGALKSSIGVDIEGMSYEAGPTVEYGAYVELGTSGPYPIRNPFGWGDDVVIMHPGNAPEPYLGPAFDVNLPSVVDEIGDAGEGIL